MFNIITMKKITFSRIIPKTEYKERIDFFTKKEKQRKIQSNKAISQSHSDIFNAYDVVSDKLHLKYLDISTDRDANIIAFKNKKCLKCGGVLKIVNDSFWGCVNYSKDEKHTTFSKDWILPKLPQTPVDRWLFDIKKISNLPDCVRSIDVLDFLLGNGLEDLRLKHIGKESRCSLKTLQKSKKRAEAQEKLLIGVLEKQFPKVATQLPIEYQIEGESKKRFCQPDIVASNRNYINVIEVKNSVSDLDRSQLETYHQVFNHLLSNSDEKRTYNVSPVVFDNSGVVELQDENFRYINYSVFDEIQGLKAHQLNKVFINTKYSNNIFYDGLDWV